MQQQDAKGCHKFVFVLKIAFAFCFEPPMRKQRGREQRKVAAILAAPKSRQHKIVKLCAAHNQLSQGSHAPPHTLYPLVVGQNLNCCSVCMCVCVFLFA